MSFLNRKEEDKGEGEGKKRGKEGKEGKKREKGKEKRERRREGEVKGKKDNFITRYCVFKGTLNSRRSQGLNFTWHYF